MLQNLLLFFTLRHFIDGTQLQSQHGRTQHGSTVSLNSSQVTRTSQLTHKHGLADAKCCVQAKLFRNGKTIQTQIMRTKHIIKYIHRRAFRISFPPNTCKSHKKHLSSWIRPWTLSPNTKYTHTDYSVLVESISKFIRLHHCQHYYVKHTLLSKHLQTLCESTGQNTHTRTHKFISKHSSKFYFFLPSLR